MSADQLRVSLANSRGADRAAPDQWIRLVPYPTVDLETETKLARSLVLALDAHYKQLAQERKSGVRSPEHALRRDIRGLTARETEFMYQQIHFLRILRKPDDGFLAGGSPSHQVAIVRLENEVVERGGFLGKFAVGLFRFVDR